MLGSVTVRNTRQPEAPSVSAASSSARPCSIITGISSRATKGKVTKTVAKTMPGTAKTIGYPLATSQPPMAEFAPNSSTMHRPATTGLTLKGRSISVIRKALPRKSNLVTNQAAAMPKTAFSGTAIAVISRVRRIADCASRLARLATAAAQPRDRASAKTMTKGPPTSRARPPTATAIIAHRAAGDSSVAERKRAGVAGL